MKVRIKKLHPDAKMPVKKHDNDFCYDVYAVSKEELAPGVTRYHTGIAMELVPETEQERELAEKYIIDIDARPRSSVWETGQILSNCEGTIDNGYRGEIMAVFYTVIPGMKQYEPGERIFQIKLGFTLPFNFEFVEELGDTSRGGDGFGKSGRKEIQ